MGNADINYNRVILCFFCWKLKECVFMKIYIWGKRIFWKEGVYEACIG